MVSPDSFKPSVSTKSIHAKNFATICCGALPKDFLASTFAKDAKVRDVWIRYIRQAMLMTLSTLEKTAGLTKATVQQIEKREADVHMTLENQRVSENIKDRIDRITEDLLAKGDIW